MPQPPQGQEGEQPLQAEEAGTHIWIHIPLNRAAGIDYEAETRAKFDPNRRGRNLELCTTQKEPAMSQTPQAQPEYIQIGVTALRDPATGGFLPAVPLYIKATDSARAGEERLIQDMARLFAQRMKQYEDATGSRRKTKKPKPRPAPPAILEETWEDGRKGEAT